jgi:hypothetical protein
MMQTDWDVLCDYTDRLMATGRYPSRYDAMREAQRRNPHLDPTPPGTQAVRPAARAATGNAEAELDRLARQVQAEQRTSYAEAYRRVLLQNPHLYTALR